MTEDDATPVDAAKAAAAAAALAHVERGMKLGLGTGSTAALFIEALGERARRETLDLVCVPTSRETGRLAERRGLTLTTLDQAGWLDLTVDGADEVDANLDLIKGAGGALLIEKIVANASDRMIVIADDRKRVVRLGASPLPIEITPFGWETTRAVVERELDDHDVDARRATLRMRRDEPFITDEGNMILDLALGRIGDPADLELALNAIPGVVDCGLFIDRCDLALFGSADGSVSVLARPEAPQA